MSIHKNSREQARLQHISVNFTGGLERALFARKTSPRHYAAAIRIKDVVQFSRCRTSPRTSAATLTAAIRPKPG